MFFYKTLTFYKSETKHSKTLSQGENSQDWKLIRNSKACEIFRIQIA